MLKTNRQSEYNINHLLLHRHSPRAFSGEAIAETDLLAMLEAASWAPSSFNNQPWRFVYAKRDTAAWDKFFSWLTPNNQAWAKQASALIVVLSRNNFTYNEQPSRTHSFDTGAAWENLALEAASRDWVAHGIEGFDRERVKSELGVPDSFTVEMMIVVGRPLEPETEDTSSRKKLQEIASENEFNFS